MNESVSRGLKPSLGRVLMSGLERVLKKSPDCEQAYLRG